MHLLAEDSWSGLTWSQSSMNSQIVASSSNASYNLWMFLWSRRVRLFKSFAATWSFFLFYSVKSILLAATLTPVWSRALETIPKEPFPRPWLESTVYPALDNIILVVVHRVWCVDQPVVSRFLGACFGFISEPKLGMCLVFSSQTWNGQTFGEQFMSHSVNWYLELLQWGGTLSKTWGVSLHFI